MDKKTLVKNIARHIQAGGVVLGTKVKIEYGKLKLSVGEYTPAVKDNRNKYVVYVSGARLNEVRLYQTPQEAAHEFVSFINVSQRHNMKFMAIRK